MEQYLIIYFKNSRKCQNILESDNGKYVISRPLEIISFLWRRPNSLGRAVKFWPHGWFCNGICDLTPKTVPFHYLLRQARSYGELCTYCSRDQMLIVFTDAWYSPIVVVGWAVVVACVVVVGWVVVVTVEVVVSTPLIWSPETEQKSM